MEELTHGTPAQVFTAVVPRLGEPAVIAVPGGATLRAAVTTITHDLPEVGRDRPLRLVAEREAARPLTGRDRDYGLAMRVAELAEQGRVEVVETTARIDALQLAGPDRIAVGVAGDHRVYGVAGEPADPPHFYRMLQATADRAEPVEVDLPTISTVTDALGERFDPMVAAAFENTLVEARSVSNRAVDAPKLLLWVGARYELSFDDVQQLAEDVGLLSHQPLSNRLSELVDAGLIVTVPEVDGPGHPTRRLELGVSDPGDKITDELLFALR